MDDASADEIKRRKVVALRYDATQDHAPKIIAKGTGHLAERILEVAREHGVVIHEDPDLMQTLAALDVDIEIPEALYRAVAEVLAFVYQTNRKLGTGSP
jgi:flagellar biosynthesis protein